MKSHESKRAQRARENSQPSKPGKYGTLYYWAVQIIPADPGHAPYTVNRWAYEAEGAYNKVREDPMVEGDEVGYVKPAKVITTQSVQGNPRGTKPARKAPRKVNPFTGQGWTENKAWLRAAKASKPVHVSAARAQEMMAQARAKAQYGPWVDQLDRVMTKGERRYIEDVWEKQGAYTSFVDALTNIAQGRVPNPKGNPAWLSKIGNKVHDALSKFVVTRWYKGGGYLPSKDLIFGSKAAALEEAKTSIRDYAKEGTPIHAQVRRTSDDTVVWSSAQAASSIAKGNPAAEPGAYRVNSRKRNPAHRMGLTPFLRASGGTDDPLYAYIISGAVPDPGKAKLFDDAEKARAAIARLRKAGEQGAAHGDPETAEAGRDLLALLSKVNPKKPTRRKAPRKCA